LTEDRKTQGLYLNMTVAENCVAPSLSRFSRAGFLKEQWIRRFAEECCRVFRIVTPSVQQKVMNLSGGNQQKVLLGRWLATHPRLLLLDEPTRGIDVGAKAEIQAEVSRLADDGVAVVFISSEIEEVVRLSERIVVLKDHHKIGEIVNGPDVTADQIVEVIARHDSGVETQLGAEAVSAGVTVEKESA